LTIFRVKFGVKRINMNEKTEGEPVPNPATREPRKKKQARWDEMAAEVVKVTDGLGLEIDSGIKDTVIALRLLGFDTDGSCEGHSDRGVCGPWVGLTSKEIEALEPEREKIFKEAWRHEEEYLDFDKEGGKRVREIDAEKLKVQARAMELITEFYQQRRVPYDVMIVVDPTINGRIQCMGTEVAEILPTKEKKVKLKQYQAEMADFTQFLKDKYFNS
jgi:hypothetical protein